MRSWNVLDRIKIYLVAPETTVSRTGNRCTAQQWADLLSEIGHEVVIANPGESMDAEMLIALHGERCHGAIVEFRKAQPEGKIIVAMTGTDIYPSPSEIVLNSMALADRIVVLQSKAVEKIPSQYRRKVDVIVQSAAVLAERKIAGSDSFDICVVGHFRDVKDPLRAAKAARMLPNDSKIRIRQAGGILDEKYRELIKREVSENPRYEWLGELNGSGVAELLASSRAMVLSSFAEGGGRVIGEAIVHGAPVLSSKIDAAVGLLGEDYAAFFEAGDTHDLAGLMLRAERDASFYSQLYAVSKSMAPKFLPDVEQSAWRELIAGL